MKTFRTVFFIASLILIAGCIKATNDYKSFTDYHASAGGFVVDFLIGYSAASQGDYLGPTLDIANQDSSLAARQSAWRFWAWIVVVITFIMCFWGKNKTDS